MAIASVIAVATVASGYQANKAKNAAIDASNQQLAQAQQEQAAQKAQAQQEQAQVALAQSNQQQAEQNRMSASQNTQTSALTPTVQLAAQGGGEASAQKSRARRAQFRPEYASGVTI